MERLIFLKAAIYTFVVKVFGLVVLRWLLLNRLAPAGAGLEVYLIFSTIPILSRSIYMSSLPLYLGLERSYDLPLLLQVVFDILDGVLAAVELTLLATTAT